MGPSYSEFGGPGLKPISPASRNLLVRLFASVYSVCALGGHVAQGPPVLPACVTALELQ